MSFLAIQTGQFSLSNMIYLSRPPIAFQLFAALRVRFAQPDTQSSTSYPVTQARDRPERRPNVGISLICRASSRCGHHTIAYMYLHTVLFCSAW